MPLRFEIEAIESVASSLNQWYAAEASSIASNLATLQHILGQYWGANTARAFDAAFDRWLTGYRMRTEDLGRIAQFLRATAHSYRETEARLQSGVGGVGSPRRAGGGKVLAKPMPIAGSPSDEEPEADGFAAWWHNLMVSLGFERDRIAFKLPQAIAAQAIPLTTAQSLFAELQADPEIAWSYPVDGCYARADAMAEFMREKYGIEPLKIWAFSDDPDDDADGVPELSESMNQSKGLTVDTQTPYDVVTWAYHVAPVIPVAMADGTIQYLVIDPSITSRPVTTEVWFDTMQASPTMVADITLSGEAPLGLVGSGYWPGYDPMVSDYTERVNDFFNFCAANGVVCTVDADTGQAYILVDKDHGYPVDQSVWYTP